MTRLEALARMTEAVAQDRRQHRGGWCTAPGEHHDRRELLAMLEALGVVKIEPEQVEVHEDRDSVVRSIELALCHGIGDSFHHRAEEVLNRLANAGYKVVRQ